MLSPLRTLRFRLTMLYVVIFGLIQAGLWVTVDAIRTSQLRSRFDHSLIERAQSMVEAIDAAVAESPAAQSPQQLAQVLKPFESPTLFFQVRNAEGQPVLRSRNMSGFNLPFAPPSDDPTVAMAPNLATIEGEVADALGGRGDKLRVLTLYHDGPNDRAYYVQVAASLQPILQLIGDIRSLLVVFGFVSLIVAGVTSWYMARRSLAPIGLIAREAKRLSASRLDQRIPVPETKGELTELVTLLNEMLDRLERDFKNQQQFIGDVSHELKTPLAVLLGEAATLKRKGGCDAEYVRFVGTVEEESRKLLRIVESFLILTRARSGRRPSMAANVAIEDVVLRSIQACARESQSRNVRVVPRLEHGENGDEPHVVGDEDLLCSMVENLLHNAIRHSPPDERVEVGLRSSEKEVLLTVRDYGPGVPAEHLPRVFDLFYQVSTESDGGGKAGIGLSIVKTVAEVHGGSVWVRNGSDKGCEFTVRLPRVASL